MVILTILGFILSCFAGIAAFVGTFRTGGLIVKAVNRLFDWLGEKLSGGR